MRRGIDTVGAPRKNRCLTPISISAPGHAAANRCGGGTEEKYVPDTDFLGVTIPGV